MRKISDNKGFTFYELLIIVMILGIMATFALPTIESGLTKTKLSGAAGEVVLALEYAQLNAMTTGTQMRVTIDTGTDSILVEYEKITGDIFSGAAAIDENDIDSGSFVTMAHPVKRGEDYQIIFSDEDRFDGVDIADSVFGINNFVTFDAMGVPSDGGTVNLKLGEEHVVVTVDSSTGKVTTSN
ncbi:GspH/FimT family pseudopilin [Thermodesulfobacteriota bacterium]